MKVNIDELKTLVEAGDEAAITEHIFASLEKGDVSAAAEANKDVLSEVDSIKDTHHSTALETFKKKQVPKLVEAAVAAEREKYEKPETPDQIRIRELEAKFEQEQLKSARATLRAQLIAAATSDEIGLDAAFVTKHIDRFIPKTFDKNEDGEFDLEAVVTAVKQELTDLSTDVKSIVTSGVETAMKGAARHDIGGGLGAGQQAEKTKGAELAEKLFNNKSEEKAAQFFK